MAVASNKVAIKYLGMQTQPTYCHCAEGFALLIVLHYYSTEGKVVVVSGQLVSCSSTSGNLLRSTMAANLPMLEEIDISSGIPYP